MDPDLSTRLDAAVARLPLSGGRLLRACHQPGVFAREAERFDAADFDALVSADDRSQPEPGGVFYLGDTSYHAWAEGDVALLDRRRDGALRETSTLRLPGWLLEVQQALLASVYRQSAFGWSCEVFWSREDGATIGVHADNDDVYTIQLLGTRRWEVDPIDLDRLDDLLRRSALSRGGPQYAWHFAPDRREALRDPECFLMQPGDFLATPAFALHQVWGTGPSGKSLASNVSVCQEQLFRERTPR